MPKRRLSRGDTELVLKRAAEIEVDRAARQARADEDEAEDLEPEEVLRLGEEAGIDREAVLHALAERRRAALLAPSPAGGGRGLGDAEIVVVREVALEIDRVRVALRRFLRRHLLVATHEDGDRAEWRRAPGLWGGIVRSLGFRRRYLLASASRVETNLESVGEGRTEVTLRLDLSELRKSRFTRALAEAAGAFGLLGLGGAWLAPEFGLTDVLALIAGGGFAGTIYALERRSFSVQREEIARVPRRFLESLERRGRGGP